MTAHLSAREAKALGLTAPSTVRRDPYHTRCVACGEDFTTMAGETRHMLSSGHRRFSVVFVEVTR